MLSLIIIILIFYIFFKKYNKKKYENFDDLNTAIENCGSPCKCKYGTDGNESDCKLCFPDTDPADVARVLAICLRTDATGDGGFA